jgi:hypothetical protein
MLTATFVRRRGQRDHVYVTRGDGTEAAWAFPTYGDTLPHDLCHLVIEDELGLRDGFWGLVDRHVEVGLVNNQATLLRDGEPLLGQPGVDFSGLQAAEAAVAVLGPTSVTVDGGAGQLAVARLAEPEHDPEHASPASSTPSADATAAIVEIAGQPLPASATPAAVAAIRDRLAELGDRWRHLDDGGAITLTFPSSLP